MYGKNGVVLGWSKFIEAYKSYKNCRDLSDSRAICGVWNKTLNFSIRRYSGETMIPHYFFPNKETLIHISEVSSMCYMTGQWSEFTIKNAILYLCILSWRFLLFSFKKFVFLSLPFIFLWSIEFSQQNINQSETKIGDKEFPLELYIKKWLFSLKEYTENIS